MKNLTIPIPDDIYETIVLSAEEHGFVPGEYAGLCLAFYIRRERAADEPAVEVHTTKGRDDG